MEGKVRMHGSKRYMSGSICQKCGSRFRRLGPSAHKHRAHKHRAHRKVSGSLNYQEGKKGLEVVAPMEGSVGLKTIPIVAGPPLHCHSMPFLFVHVLTMDVRDDDKEQEIDYPQWHKIDLEREVAPLTLDQMWSGYPYSAEDIKACPDFHVSSGSAACGSKLFMFGGDLNCLKRTSESVDEVFSYDTTDTSTSWIKHDEKMLSCRHDPAVIVIKDNIYIFGTACHPKKSSRRRHSMITKPWGEIWNTTLGSITAVTDPPPLDLPSELFNCSAKISCTAVIDHGDKKKILMRTGGIGEKFNMKVFYFDVNDGEWEDISELHPNFLDPTKITSRRSAVIDGILYTYNYKNVYVYDLENGNWFKYPVLGLLEDDPCCFIYDSFAGFVLNMGNGKLCLGYCTSLPIEKVDETQHLVLHYAIFTPHIEGDGVERFIKPEVHCKGHQSFRGNHLIDAWAMWEGKGAAS